MWTSAFDVGDALEERHELLERHRPVTGQPLGERDALDELHRDPEQPSSSSAPEA
jgi:hypothetical protein